jgi:hypothetical protein
LLGLGATLYTAVMVVYIGTGMDTGRPAITRAT